MNVLLEYFVYRMYMYRSTCVYLIVYRGATPSTYEVKPLSISEVVGAQPTSDFEETSTVDGVK